LQLSKNRLAVREKVVVIESDESGISWLCSFFHSFCFRKHIESREEEEGVAGEEESIQDIPSFIPYNLLTQVGTRLHPYLQSYQISSVHSENHHADFIVKF
jgi:hypothetical protein